MNTLQSNLSSSIDKQTGGLTDAYRDPYFIFFCLAVIAFPLSSWVLYSTVVALLLYWIWKKGYHQLWTGIKKRQLAQFLIALAVMEGIGFLYTERTQEGLKYLEKIAFTMPMTLMFAGTLSFTEKRRNVALYCLTGIFTLLMVICYVQAVRVTGHFYPHQDAETFQYANGFSRAMYTQIIGAPHPGYLSITLLVIVAFLLLQVLDRHVETTVGVVATVAAILFSIMTLIILSSKVHIALLALMLVFFVLRQLLRVSGRTVKIVTLGAGAAITLLVAYVIITNGQIQYRFVNEMPLSLQQKKQQWTAALTVWQEHPWTGVGLGDRQAELDNAYTRLGFVENLERNSHNQFLDLLVSFGIVGFAWLLVVMISWFVRSIRQKDVCFFLFNVVFFASCITESVLHRYFGVSLFILFSIIFTFKTENADQ
jgi:O-antigen ligase